MLAKNGCYEIGGIIYTPEELYTRYERTVKDAMKLITANPRGAFDREDLFQEGCITLLTAAEKYDSSNAKGASFETFAVTCIRNRLFTILRVAGMHRDIVNMDTSFDEAFGYTDSAYAGTDSDYEPAESRVCAGMLTELDMEDAAANSDALARLEALVNQKASDSVKKGMELIRRRMEGYSYEELEEMYSTSYGNLRLMICRAKQFAKDHANEWLEDGIPETQRVAAVKSVPAKKRKKAVTAGEVFGVVVVSSEYEQYSFFRDICEADLAVKKVCHRARRTVKGITDIFDSCEQLSMFAV